MIITLGESDSQRKFQFFQLMIAFYRLTAGGWRGIGAERAAIHRPSAGERVVGKGHGWLSCHSDADAKGRRCAPTVSGSGSHVVSLKTGVEEIRLYQVSVGVGGQVFDGQQLAAIGEQTFHILQADHLLGIQRRILVLLPIQLQLHGSEALLQPHQPLGEGMNRLRQIFRVPADSKREGIGGHRLCGRDADDNTDPNAGQGGGDSRNRRRTPGMAAVDRYVRPCLRASQTVTLAHRCRPQRRPGLASFVIPLAGALAAAWFPSAASLAQGQQSGGTAASGPGAKGAQVYCFMRGGGNDHQVSWNAAYAVIKRQSDRLFKTSPEHAAVMITESVVQNPDVYPDCSRYLGDLFRKPEPQPDAGASTDKGGVTRSERLGQ